MGSSAAAQDRPRRELATGLGPLAQLRAGKLARRLPQLLIGLVLYGCSMALMVRGALGVMPWDVLHQGVSRQVPLSFGHIVIGISLIVLLLWIPLRQHVGLGTVANALVIGLVVDPALALIPETSGVLARIALMTAGIVLNAVATAMYIGAQLGPGPRDGLMTGLAARTGLSLRVVRTGLEVAVVALGWLLGGQFGLATVLYALAIGPLTQALLPLLIAPLDASSVGGTPYPGAHDPRRRPHP